MDDEDQTELLARLQMLREQHRDLDSAVEALEAAGSTDLLQIKRLKKRKLMLKDEMTYYSGLMDTLSSMNRDNPQGAA